MPNMSLRLTAGTDNLVLDVSVAMDDFVTEYGFTISSVNDIELLWTSLSEPTCEMLRTAFAELREGKLKIVNLPISEHEASNLMDWQGEPLKREV
jgi:hypothetical protein